MVRVEDDPAEPPFDISTRSVTSDSTMDARSQISHVSALFYGLSHEFVDFAVVGIEGLGVPVEQPEQIA